MKTKELLELVKKSPWRGSSWLDVKGNRAPGKKQVELLRKYKIILDVDPKIRNLIIDLNEKGFKTYGSCAGHVRMAFGTMSGGGFVTIVKHKTIPYKESQIVIKKIFKKHGINKIVIDDSKTYACKDGRNMFAVDFKSIGNFYKKVKNKLPKVNSDF